MDTLTLLILTFVAISVVLNILVLSRLSAIANMLRSPKVKRLSQEMNLKSQSKSFPKDVRARNRNDKPEQRNERSDRNDRGDNRRDGGRDNNRNRNPNSNPNPRNQRNDRNGAGRRPNRTNSTPQEMMNNDSDTSAPASNSSENSAPAVETRNINSASTANNTNAGRPQLAPRGVDANAQVEPSNKPSVNVESQDSSHNEDTRNIRHGRRTQIKKAPMLDEVEK
jgi:hypothetical protein